MLSYIYLTVFVTATSVSANICCYKNEFQGILLQSGAEMVKGVPQIIDRNMTLYYNYDTKMMRIEYDEQGTVYNLYQDYNKKKEYITFNGTCTQSDMTTAMQAPCVPDSATAVANHVIGGPTENLTAITYHVGDDQNWMRITVTPDTCTPIAQVQLDLVDVTPSVTSIAFLDLEGIDGVHVFNLPSYC